MADTLLDTFELMGKWWVPSNPKRKLDGVLSYAPGKVFLSVDSVHGFREIPPSKGFAFVPFDSSPIPIIVGTTTANQHVVLVNSTPYLWGGYYVAAILLSDHETSFKAIEDINFSRMTVRCSLLEEWVSHFPLEGKVLFEKDENRVTGINIQYSVPDPIEVYIPNIGSKIIFRFVSSYPSRSAKRLTISQSAFMEIKPDHSQTFEWFSDLVQHLEKLISILAGAPVYRTSLSATDQEGGDSEDDVLIFHLIAYKDIPEPPLKVFLPLSILDDDMRVRVFSSWFDLGKRQLMEDLSELFLHVRYSKDIPRQMQLLSLVQALETFSRQKYGDKNQYLPNDEFAEYLGDIKQFVELLSPKKDSDEHRERLLALKSRLVGEKGKDAFLEHANEFSLNDKLKLLLDSVNQDPALGEIIDIDDKLRSKIVASRHYYTHFNKKKRKSALAGSRLHEANSKLALLITTVILLELGLSTSQIIEILGKHKNLPLI